VTSTSLVEVDDLATIRALVGRSAEADRLHPIGLREVVSGPGAVSMLPTVLARLAVAETAVVVILTDDVPKACRERDVLDVVEESIGRRSPVHRVTLPSPPGPASPGVHADEMTLDLATEGVRALAAGALVTVGSGTLADIGKVVANRLDLTHVVVQTAASVNGYADDQSVLLRNGTKRTTPSRWPEALVIDPDVLSAAPLAMTRSGLGDLLSTFTAAADWQLASIVGFDPSYSPTAVTVLRAGIDEAVGAAAGLATNEPRAVRALASSLTRGGLAMGLAGRTSPSSGAEHTVSHLLEMHANARGLVGAAHGAQVGAASVVMARAWAAMGERLRSGRLTVSALDRDSMRARVTRAFLQLDASGAVADECWSAYERKLGWVNAHLSDLQAVCEQWARYDAKSVALLADPTTLSDTLRTAGAAARLTELDPDPGAEAAHWAVANCHLMRDRFTIVDLAELTGGWTDEDVEQVLR
jgi:glycerol-1-phosphate dehydrogenase [NAD(P)+]